MGNKKDTREQGGGRQERQEFLFFLFSLSSLSFLFFLFFLSFLSGDQVALFSLPLLVAKVAQKPRTTSLAEARVAKPKTNATRVKRLPSLFLNGFATLASRDRQVGRLPADDAKCGF